MMIRPSIFVVASVIGALSPLAALAATRLQAQGPPAPAWDQHVAESAARQLELGRTTFRHDTFGSEAFWGGELRLHEALAKVSPADALALGLKVDSAALPQRLAQDLRKGRVDLEDPAATLALLASQAVVGVTGFFDDGGALTSVGIQCALCHSAVDDSLSPGIGERLDGWANRDLDIGGIVALAPDLTPFSELLGVSADAVRDVLRGWGRGKFDAQLVLDGKTSGPNGSAATLIPPAFGLAGINLHTWTGWGSVTHWNAFVAVIEMRGKGTFIDARLDDAVRFPVAAAAGFGRIVVDPADDRVTPVLGALHAYQLALPPPAPPPNSFDPVAAQRGAALFLDRARCATCHVPPLFSEPGWNLHAPAEIGIDAFQAERSPDRRYRTAPLRGLWTHQQGGFYHDGRFATLADVIEHYDVFFALGLAPAERADLAQYLLSL
jgi:hypothetical protein